MRRYFRADDIGTVWKENNTPITVADTTINEMVIERIKAVFPDHGVHGEEGSYQLGQEWMWVCDPVDGTLPFSNGLPLSTFSLALVRSGTVQLGVIYDPFNDRLWHAQKGEGAFLNGKPVHVNKSDSLQNSRIDCEVWASKKHTDQLVIPAPGLRDVLLDAGAQPVVLSSAVIGGALVACGDFSGLIFCVKKPEDIAALKVIVEEAGGRVTDLRGNDQRYDQGINGAIVSNGVLHDQLLKAVTSCVSLA